MGQEIVESVQGDDGAEDGDQKEDHVQKQRPADQPENAARRQNGPRGERQMYEVICDGCGATTQVPFQPRGDRPVYCRECFAKNRPQF